MLDPLKNQFFPLRAAFSTNRRVNGAPRSFPCAIIFLFALTIAGVAAGETPAEQFESPDPFRQGAPYVGVSYYLEVAGDLLDGDVRHMRQLGVNMVRFGEFAWSRIEPREGQCDFGWMHQAVDKFVAAKIAVVVCTPTAAPPVWLSAATRRSCA